MSDDEYFPSTAVGNSLAKFGGWMRDRVSSLATEISTALLEDLPEFREQLQREFLFGDEDDIIGNPRGRLSPVSSPEVERMLNDSATYSEDPSDSEDFRQFQYTAEDVRDIRSIYPCAAQHVEETSAELEDQVWKRLLYKLRQLEKCQMHQSSLELSEEYDAVEDMVVVHSGSHPAGCASQSKSIFIVGDSEGELIEWS